MINFKCNLKSLKIDAASTLFLGPEQSRLQGLGFSNRAMKDIRSKAKRNSKVYRMISSKINVLSCSLVRLSLFLSKSKNSSGMGLAVGSSSGS